MKKNKIFSLILVACTLLCFGGCKTAEEQGASVPSTVIPEQTTLAAADIFEVKEYTKTFNGTDGKPCFAYRYYLPYFDSLLYPQYESINQYFSEVLQHAESNGKTFAANLAGANGLYSEIATFLVSYRNSNFISLIVSVKSNDGTQEKLLRKDLSTFSLADGRQLHLSDFSAHFSDTNLSYIAADTVNQCSQAAPSAYTPSFQTVMDKINGYRFCLTQTGIVLYFETGELLPESYGPQLFLFEKDEIKKDLELLPQ